MSTTLPLWKVLDLTGDPGTGAMIGLDDYPIFDDNEDERERINRLIIQHFLLRNIGQETISIFTLFLRRTMHEIMPTYNQLYKSSMIQFDPLSTYDLTTVRNGTAKEKGTSTSDSSTGSKATAKSRNVQFDTPQTALAGNKDYASAAADGNSENDSSGTSTGKASSESDAENTDTSRTTGRQGSGADMLMRYRATIINTDLMLLNDPELTSCFLGVWDTGDEIAAPQPLRLGRY